MLYIEAARNSRQLFSFYKEIYFIGLAPGTIKAAFRTKQNNEPFFLKYITGVVREDTKNAFESICE